jgi:hypothetical protein
MHIEIAARQTILTGSSPRCTLIGQPPPLGWEVNTNELEEMQLPVDN